MQLTATMSGLAPAGLCSVLGPAGALLGPVAATGIAYVGKVIGGPAADAAGGVLSGILGNLSATATEGLLATRDRAAGPVRRRARFLQDRDVRFLRPQGP